MDDVQKKRHHYVPITYLNRFTDGGGRIYAYRKDDPAKSLHLRPSEIAFERYYYSQPLPEGGQDNNRLEDLFSKIETAWPGLVDDLSGRRDLGNRIEQLFEFIGLLRSSRPRRARSCGTLSRPYRAAKDDGPGRVRAPAAAAGGPNVRRDRNLDRSPPVDPTPWFPWSKVLPGFGSSAGSR